MNFNAPSWVWFLVVFLIILAILWLLGLRVDIS